jgi:hypothetical protein
MKTVTSSIAYQDESGNPLVKGSLILSLPAGVYLIASGGGQVVGTSVIINLDGSGKIPAGIQLWASDELSPQTPYSATVCSGANGIGSQASATWFIGGASPIDLSQLTPVANSQPSFLSPVVLTPTAAQTITGQPLILASSTPLTANGTVSVAGTTSLSGGGSLAGTFTGNPTLSGNPAFTGSPTFSLIQATGYQSASTNRAAAGVVRMASTDTLNWRNNANSADVPLSKNASDQFLLGSTLVPNSSDTAVLRTTTDTLTNKTIGAGGLAGLTLTKQVFTSSGTFTIPSGITSVKVTLVGAGGAGGGATATNNGGGGGSGGAALKWLPGLTPSNTLTVTVGAGGTGVSAAAGNAGGASSISSGTQTITTVTANGGSGGNANGSQSSGGSGAAISTNGDANFGGVSGFDGIGVSGGPGAGSMFGGGAPNSTGGQPGNAALSTGGGGGGAGAGANRTGGSGANGIIVFEWVN